MIYFIIFTVIGYVIGKLESRDLFRLQKKMFKIGKIKKVHIHHDMVGLLLIFGSLIIRPYWLGASISGVGFGMLIHHITTEGFKFITYR